MSSSGKPGNPLSPVSSSYVDPHGRLFREHDSLVRAIFEEYSPFYQDLFDKGIVRRLIEKDLLVETDPVQDRSDKELLVRHARIEPVSYPFEWSPLMLKHAALKTLRLAMELLDHNLTLQDATPYNIVFDCWNPVFVDFTSLSPIDGAFLWKPYDQFLRLFYLPLVLYSLGAYGLSRMALTNYHRGIEYGDMRNLLPLRAKLANLMLLEVPHHLNRRCPELKRLSVSRYIDDRMRKRFFLNLERKVERIRIRNKATPWTGYWDDTEGTGKMDAVERILRELKPRRVLDIGANTGHLSFLAAEHGALVVAVESDWECTDIIFARAEERRARVLPLCIDVLAPTPSFGWNLCQYDGFFTRLKADLVIMAAIVHHLVLSQWQDFERVARFADLIAEKHLLVEYVDGADPMCREMAPVMPPSYRKENLLNALGKHFRVISESPLTSTRTLILCVKR